MLLTANVVKIGIWASAAVYEISESSGSCFKVDFKAYAVIPGNLEIAFS